jgi:enoyl reductase-like protein
LVNIAKDEILGKYWADKAEKIRDGTNFLNVLFSKMSVKSPLFVADMDIM